MRSTVWGREIYDSARRPPPMVEELGALWRYRDLIVQLVRRDVGARYKRSVLGVAWTMLNPLGMMLVLTLVFSQLFRGIRAYPAYVLIGLVVWNFFSQSTVQAMRQLVWGGTLLHRIYIPRTIFAASAVGTSLVNLVLALVPLFIIILLTGVPLGWSVLFIPVAVLLLAAFALGVGLLMSRLAVFFPDVAEMYDVATIAWMYLTPIFYPEEIIPESIRWWFFNLNPMYHLLKLFRQPLYYGVWPSPERIASAAAVALVALLCGWILFTQKADEMAYRV